MSDDQFRRKGKAYVLDFGYAIHRLDNLSRPIGVCAQTRKPRKAALSDRLQIRPASDSHSEPDGHNPYPSANSKSVKTPRGFGEIEGHNSQPPECSYNAFAKTRKDGAPRFIIRRGRMVHLPLDYKGRQAAVSRFTVANSSVCSSCMCELASSRNNWSSLCMVSVLL